MKRKYIYTFIIIIQALVLLFVVSYAWIDGDFYQKKITGYDLKVSTTDELILSYKNKTYSSLNLNTTISNSFSFSQVTSTGEYESAFYKIDYSPELNDKPAVYTLATAGTDYLVFDITLSTTSKAKRVYLDGANSGFYGYTDDPNATPSTLAANAMRCSLSFLDDDNVRRNILFANNADNTNRTIVESDLYTIDTTNGNQWYNNGVAQFNYDAFEEAAGGGSGNFLSGKPTYVQNCKAFTDYDISTSTQNNILFDLEPYQSRNVRLILWLEGSQVPDNDDSRNYIAGNKVRFSLKFSSSTSLSTDCSEKFVASGMTIDTIQNYLSNASTTLSNYSIDYTNVFYKLTEFGSDTDASSIECDGLTYNRVRVGDTYYYKCTTNADLFYYNLSELQAYLNFNDLSWKLINNTANLGTIGADNLITINTGLHGDTFNLIGYVTINSSELTVVNEKYIFSDVTSVENIPHIITATLSEGTYGVYTVDVSNLCSGAFTYVNNGEVENHQLDDLTWEIKNGINDFSTGVNNFAAFNATTYELSVNLDNYFTKKADASNNVSVSFNLVGYYNSNKVVNLIIVVVG